MVFTSQIFLFYFLPLALLGYYALPQRWRNLFLTLASYVFYGWWSPWFVTLMLASTVVDWFCGVAITAPDAAPASRKRAVTISVVTNLALLGFFKYFMFAQENINRLMEVFGSDSHFTLTVILPVGISFYSFQSMSYSIDLYQGTAKRARSFRDFACYVSMFPQLVAGPIVRYHDIATQLDDRPQHGELFYRGALNFMIGFAKKILIANTLGEVSDLALAAESLPAHVAWFGILAQGLQLYFDFSGYSDMAIGLGQMFGFVMPLNFFAPYRALSMSEFWTRWHISLSNWLRDYVYIPLGGNRGSAWFTNKNLMITMFLGGLWHGAAWTFIAWGVCHGLVLVTERLLGEDSWYARLPDPLRMFRSAMYFSFSLVLWRVPDLGTAAQYYSALVLGVDASTGDAAQGAVMAARVYQPAYVFVMLIAVGITWLSPLHWIKRVESSTALTLATFALFLLSIVAMYSQAENPFLYFRF
ncbi:MAG: alginate O-acetyltransferase complex protein AlgI [Planctomycetota bacterium]|jgi:alginate O-acetyltransferase complex protein AlgI